MNGASEAISVLPQCRYAANLQVAKVLSEERRMDFNTGGSGGRQDDESRPLYGGEAGGPPPGGPPRGPAASSGGEFNLQDPVGSFLSTVRNVVLNPVGFFQGIPRQGNFVNPLVFALICAVVSGILGGIVNFLIGLAFSSGNQGVTSAFLSLIGNIILTPIGVAIGVFIGAGIYHLLVLLLVRPSNAGFEATFRVVAYTSVIQLVSWIPLVGIIAGLYGVVLSVFGIREVHNTTTGRALAVVLIPIAVVVLLVLLVFGAALLFYILGSQQQPV
jgi:hypothetical protein